jgi:glycosyltransferase involved in cell wall biosynthesis
LIKNQLKIVILEPYYGGSHKQWIDQLICHSSHSFTLLQMPSRFWKWRMQAGAIYLAEATPDEQFDLILASSMLNLPLYLSLIRKKKAACAATAIYFHENQICYPLSDHEKARARKNDFSYGFINIASALSADIVFFNSTYHYESFFQALPLFMKKFPDYNDLPITDLTDKSRVLPIGIDTDSFSSKRTSHRQVLSGSPPKLLWSHRREYDKNPEGFLQLLLELQKREFEFNLLLLGDTHDRAGGVFTTIEEQFARNILFNGYAKAGDEYSEMIQQADFLPVTSNHEFFGISVMEAVFCGVIPLLPEHLVYPTLYKPFSDLLYRPGDYIGMADLLIKLHSSDSTVLRDRLHEHALQYSWNHLIDTYDKELVIAANQ